MHVTFSRNMNEYYFKQAGNGITGYSGLRYQRGNGFFGRFISGGVLPFLKSVLPYIGKNVFATGANIAEDMINGENFKSSAKKQLKSTARGMAKDAISKVKSELSQAGRGIKRKR